ncbi:MAG: alpha,alpha-trehalose-phosphate synthase (UDP-forming) [Streptosporangiaceae bacterium]
MEQRVLVASNRGPVSYEFDADGNLSSRRGGGGLIAGLTSGLAAVGSKDEVTWICAALSDADRAAAHLQGRPSAVSGVQEPPVRMLDIPQRIFEGAYNSVANAALWFVHHMLFDTPNQPQFGLTFRHDWDAYVDYNRAFADALVEQAERGQVPPGGVRALIQDYHLALAPRMLRDRAAGRSPDLRIAHFSHTPWAPPAYYQMLPDEVGRAVLDGMLGADHVGFLAARWAVAFLDCCAAFLGADVDLACPADSAPAAGLLARVRYRDRVTEVAVHPLGVDAPALRERAQADDVRAHVEALGRAAGGRRLIVRIDRTELSKNIVRGLAAYRELLVTRPEWRGRVVHLAFAYPSRSAVPEYRAYTDRVQRLARQISEEFGTADWNPLILEVRDDYPRSLAACALADVLLVNPIRDGMNLVAQEGPVLSERGCALVLSREAGAASTLGADALIVNPYDITETAAALHQALLMPDAERQRRGAALAATAASWPPARWLGDQLASLASQPLKAHPPM